MCVAFYLHFCSSTALLFPVSFYHCLWSKTLWFLLCDFSNAGISPGSLEGVAAGGCGCCFVAFFFKSWHQNDPGDVFDLVCCHVLTPLEYAETQCLLCSLRDWTARCSGDSWALVFSCDRHFLHARQQRATARQNTKQKRQANYVKIGFRKLCCSCLSLGLVRLLL